MTLSSASMLFATLLALAVTPTLSSLTVASRVASSGVLHGVYVTLGIVTGDLVFLILAVSGVALIVAALDDIPDIFPYLGSLYLVFVHSRNVQETSTGAHSSHLIGSVRFDKRTNGASGTLQGPLWSHSKPILFAATG